MLDYLEELREAGWTDEQAERERAYLERVEAENAYFSANPNRLYVADQGQEEF